MVLNYKKYTSRKSYVVSLFEGLSYPIKGCSFTCRRIVCFIIDINNKDVRDLIIQNHSSSGNIKNGQPKIKNIMLCVIQFIENKKEHISPLLQIASGCGINFHVVLFARAIIASGCGINFHVVLFASAIVTNCKWVWHYHPCGIICQRHYYKLQVSVALTSMWYYLPVPLLQIASGRGINFHVVLYASAIITNCKWVWHELPCGIICQCHYYKLQVGVALTSLWYY